MTPEERRHKLTRILDDLDRALAEYEDTDDNLQELAKHVVETSAAVRAMTARLTDGHVALRRAVSATMAATRAALALYNEPKDEDR